MFQCPHLVIIYCYVYLTLPFVVVVVVIIVIIIIIKTSLSEIWKAKTVKNVYRR